LLGTGSEADPFRIGLTSLQLMERYIVVQNDPDLTTLIHLDCTHGVVKQKYPVFVVGISDCAGGFLPIVYYCASQRRGVDISWCLAFLKRVVFSEIQVRFKPDFVMMDADKAQYNACAAELPETTVLMCWFHVTQNVHKYADENGLDGVSRPLLFRNLYDLHFAPDEDSYMQKRAFVIASWNGASLCVPDSNHIIKTWFLDPRFSKWQAYHTPTGYAATNNPLETYHY
ncbi:hypothetical protein PHYSODRAFT_380775, partial [Phytophthora sojae]